MRKPILTIAAVLTIAAACFATVAAQKKSPEGKMPKTRDITIYVYQRPAEKSGEFFGRLIPVRRKIIDYKPLDAVLKLLLRGANQEEQNRNLTNFIFGLEFYSARVRNKTAQINFKFDNPEIALESWEGGGFDHENFVKAVNRTAKQFPGIERVSICVDGMKNYVNYDRSDSGKCPYPMFPPAPARAVPPDEVWDVEIYLNHRAAPVLPMGARVALPVKRRVKAADFLNETLKAFDAGATRAERLKGWSSASYGARFVSARLKNKKPSCFSRCRRARNFRTDSRRTVFVSPSPIRFFNFGMKSMKSKFVSTASSIFTPSIRSGYRAGRSQNENE